MPLENLICLPNWPPIVIYLISWPDCDLNKKSQLKQLRWYIYFSSIACIEFYKCTLFRSECLGSKSKFPLTFSLIINTAIGCARVEWKFLRSVGWSHKDWMHLGVHAWLKKCAARWHHKKWCGDCSWKSHNPLTTQWARAPKYKQ